MQEKFVEQTHEATLYFRDGRKYAYKGRRFIMEHAGSRGKITAGAMWEFVRHFIKNKPDMGIIHRYKKTRKISQGMGRLINRTKKEMSHILIDIEPKFRHIKERIAREL